MGTRGAVAVGDSTEWRGVYNHAGSEPPTLGAAVWRALADARAAGVSLAEFARAVVDAGRWEAFVARESVNPPDTLTSTDVDPLFIEWIYVIDVPTRRLHVIGHAPTTARHDKWMLDLVDSFALDGEEPDWQACQKRHTRKHADKRLAYIRERFGDSAYASARRQMLGDDDTDAY